MMTHDAQRRAVLTGAASMFALAACGPRPASAASPAEKAFADSPVRKLTDAQWKARLKPMAYKVLRHEGTERPGTSPLLKEKRQGQFVCAGCGLPLFDAKWKYESGTGWPSFFDVIKTNVGFTTDMKIGIPRKEYHCARCLGHQGHVFEDGPRPTGLRYCNNGVALKFVAA